MTLLEAIQTRHSVRSYTDKKMEGTVLADLTDCLAECNREGGLHLQLCLEDEGAFKGLAARLGSLKGVRNYIALVGEKGPDLAEKAGYSGENLGLRAQQLGLNSCWVAATYRKGKTKAAIGPGEQLVMVIALGYGTTQGAPRQTKPIEALSSVQGGMPDWFRRGMECVQLAPSAMNRQPVLFSLEGTHVRAEAGRGAYAKTDLGIAKYHFEIGAAEGSWSWAQE